MAKLIAKLARQSDLSPGSLDCELSQLSSRYDPNSGSSNLGVSLPQMQTDPGGVQVMLTKPQDALIDVESFKSRNISVGSGGRGAVTYDCDEQPLQEERDWDRMGRRRSELSCQ